MNRVRRVLILFVLVAASLSFAKPAFAIVPEVRNVVPYDVGSNTVLNITIYHFPEESITPHYVDIINITIGQDTISFHIGVQPLSPDNTFTIQHNVGLVPAPLTDTVQAHCTVNGWSAANWTGQVPEFSSFALLLAFTLAASGALFVSRRVKQEIDG